MNENEDMAKEIPEPILCSDTSPRSKKMRLANDERIKTWNVNAILNPKYTENVYSKNAVAFLVKDRTKISTIVKKLDKHFPILDKERFIKRVRIKQGSEQHIFILISIFEKDDGASVEKFTYQNQDKLKDLELDIDGCEIFATNVPASAPKTRTQFEKAKAIWPCHFHQDKTLESIINCTKEDIWGTYSLAQHISHMKHTLANCNPSDNATTIVDPKTNKVILTSTGDKKHPIRHAIMNAIDQLANARGGGAWRNKSPPILGSYKTDSNVPEASAGYLLNSCDVYVKYEPCIMCAMALVHSRVRRVFFNKLSSKGALQTLAQVHIMEELNHAFEVYRMIELDEI